MFNCPQLQSNLQATLPQVHQQQAADDDIDRALNELQVSLEGGNQLTPSVLPTSDIMHVPELKANLKFMKWVN